MREDGDDSLRRVERQSEQYPEGEAEHGRRDNGAHRPEQREHDKKESGLTGN